MAGGAAHEEPECVLWTMASLVVRNLHRWSIENVKTLVCGSA